MKQIILNIIAIILVIFAVIGDINMVHSLDSNNNYTIEQNI